MNRLLSTVVAACCALPVAAQLPETVQRSSSPTGIRIQGDTPSVRTPAKNSGAAALGAADVASTATGAVVNSGNVQIKGSTRIDAQSREVNAVAVGKGNQAGNAVGAIGDK